MPDNRQPEPDAAPCRDDPRGNKRLTIDLPRDVHRRLKTLAAQQELTMAAVLRQVLAEWLQREGGERRPDV